MLIRRLIQQTLNITTISSEDSTLWNLLPQKFLNKLQRIGVAESQHPKNGTLLDNKYIAGFPLVLHSITLNALLVIAVVILVVFGILLLFLGNTLATFLPVSTLHLMLHALPRWHTNSWKNGPAASSCVQYPRLFVTSKFNQQVLETTSRRLGCLFVFLDPIIIWSPSELREKVKKLVLISN